MPKYLICSLLFVGNFIFAQNFCTVNGIDVSVSSSSSLGGSYVTNYNPQGCVEAPFTGNINYWTGNYAGGTVTYDFSVPVSSVRVAYNAVNYNDYGAISINGPGLTLSNPCNFYVAGNIVYGMYGNGGWGAHHAWITVSSSCSFTSLTLTNVYNTSGFVFGGPCEFILTPAGAVTQTSIAGTNAQTICANSPLSTISYSTTGATGAVVTGLPAGVTSSFVSNTVNITGTPQVPGTYNYTITLVGGCGAGTTAQGSITVLPSSTIQLSSAVGTNAQTVCLTNSLVNITYATTLANSATFSGLPPGVSGNFNANTVTLSGTPTTAGVYNYTVNLSGGCGTTSASGIITVQPLGAVTLTSPLQTLSQTLCINDAIANVEFSTAGITSASCVGLPPGLTGSFDINTNSYSIVGSPTTSGVFPYTISFVGNCGTLTESGTLTVHSQPLMNAGSDQVLCQGQLITLSGSGSSLFSWNNGVTNGIAFVPTIGTTTYTLTGTSVEGCTATDQVSITVNPLPSVNAGADQTICVGASVTLAASGATSYSWDNGVVNGTAFAPLATTTYTVTGTDANACSNTDQVLITVNPLPTVNAGLDQTICVGASVTLTASGASSYSWDNGVTNGTAFAPSATTTYTVIGTSAAGCTSTDQVSITVNPLPSVNAGLDQTICVGTSVTLAASGATSYSWDNGVVNGTAFAPAATTTYTVIGTSAAGCTSTDQVSVTVNPLPSVNAGADQTICVGASVTLTASGATSYSWNNGVVNGTAFAPAATTTYTVTGTDANACSNTDQVLITVNPLPSVNAGADQTICVGASVTLTASGAASYSWNNGVVNGTAFAPAATTTYTVTGTDANACSNTDQVLITVNPLPSVNAGADQTICVGASVTLAASGATSYSWDNGVVNGTAFAPAATTTYTVIGTSAAGCTSTDQVSVTVNPLPAVNAGADQTFCVGASVTLAASGATSYSWDNGVVNGTAFAPLATTTYTVTGTDANACSNTDQVLITVNPLPTVNAGADQTICVGASVTLTASGASSYSWDNGVTNGTAFAPSATTTYTVTGTSGAGCTSTDQVSITVNPLPSVNAGADQTICLGTSVTLAASGATSYSWDNGVVNGTAFAPLATTTYTVTGTDANACSNTDQVLITVNPLPNVNAGADQTICVGASVTLAASGATSYSWDNGVVNGTAFAPLATTTYTVTGTDANACSNTDQVLITVNPLPSVNAGLDQTICAGASVTLTASGATSYSWDNGITNGTAFAPAATTTYTVIGTSGAGCTSTDQVSIAVNPLPSVNAGGDQTICVGASVTLAASGATSYSWDNGVVNGTAFAPLATTTYTVTGTDANACSNTDQVLITVNPLPSVNAGADQTICVGASVTLTASGATSYSWNNGVVNGTAFAPLATTTYTVTGTDAHACSNTDQVLITVNPLPSVNAGLDQTICAGASVTLTASGATSYSWDNGITNGTAFAPLATTTYTVIGTSGAGCTSTDQVSITVNPLPTVNAGLDQTICMGTSVTLSASGATSYSWDNGVVNGTAFAPAATTTYTVTGTDANACSNTDQVLITVNPLPTVNAGADQTICVGASVTLTASGASSYSWDNGMTNGTAFAPLATTTYSVTGTDANACSNTDQVLITVNPLPTVNAGADQTICVGASVTLSASGATSYSWDNGVVNGTAFAPLATTTYTVTGTDANACSNTDQVLITVNPLPNVNAGLDQTICVGASVTLAASGATSYSWDNGVTNGTAFAPLVTTTYTVTGTDANACSNNDQVLITVNPLPSVNAGLDQTICVGASVTLSASGATSYSWNNGVTNGTAFAPAATTTYTVTGTSAAGCTSTDQVSVTVNPLPIVAFMPDVTQGCVPLTVSFTNLTPNTTNCVWTMSDGTTMNDCGTVTTTFTVPGCYDVTLTTTSNNGCVNTETISNLICTENTPSASFIPSTAALTELNSIVSCNNTSNDASAYVWDFGDNSSLSTLENPTHDYLGNETGAYLITLIAYSPLGCSDTASASIELREELLFYVPNSFTPDGNAYNQTFLPVFTSGFDPFDYTLLIFNRWGEIVFESHDATIGWDGSYGINGENRMVQEGVYSWKIEFKTRYTDERKMLAGHVNVLR